MKSIQKYSPETYLKLEKFGEYFTYFVVGFGIVVINLPLGAPINKSAIYLVVISMTVFAFIWHRLIPKKSAGPLKTFIETIVDLVAISVAVHFSGGVRSYFMFLYLVPNFDVAMYLPFRFSLVTLGLSSVFIVGQALFGAGEHALSTSLSYSLLNIWALALVISYGRILNQEVQDAKEKEEKAKVERVRSINKLKDEFVFIIAHELRSPITAIRGYLDLIVRDKNLPNEAFKLAKGCFREGTHLALLVTNLLEISRIETGKLNFYLTKFEVGGTVKDILNELKDEAEAKNIELVFKEKDKVEVTSDPDRFKEILVNILKDSLDFLKDEGKIVIEEERQNGNLQIEVSDTGKGIPPEVREHLFEKFYPLTSGLKENVQGVGLEVYISKELIERMKGKIEVDSEVGVGTTYKITLPLNFTVEESKRLA